MNNKKEIKYLTLETLAENIQIHYKIFLVEPERDYDSGAEIRTVSRNEMPYNVAGFYTPSINDITLPNDRSYGSSFDIFVRVHESVHATYGTTNEYQTDCLAAAKTGHYEFVRNGIIVNSGNWNKPLSRIPVMDNSQKTTPIKRIIHNKNVRL